MHPSPRAMLGSRRQRRDVLARAMVAQRDPMTMSRRAWEQRVRAHRLALEQWPGVKVTRRHVLRLGALGALTGLVGCDSGTAEANPAGASRQDTGGGSERGSRVFDASARNRRVTDASGEPRGGAVADGHRDISQHDSDRFSGPS